MDLLIVLLIAMVIGANSKEHGDLARLKCKHYSKLINHFEWNPSLSAKCNLAAVPLIIGGSNVERTEFPHMAAIGFGELNHLSYSCGGSLISDRFVLTAAHCIKHRELGRASVVRLGSIDLNINDEHTHVIAIRKIHPHPDYKPTSKYNDIALMELTEKVHFTEYVRPACLNIDNYLEWSDAIAIGFGRESFDQMLGSQNLLKVHLSHSDDVICHQTYKRNRQMAHGVIDSQLCAGDPDGKRDTCQGDSGGPLQVLKPHCVYSIIGITSFGKFCGFAKSPAIYTKIAYYIDWIEKIVWRNEYITSYSK